MVIQAFRNFGVLLALAALISQTLAQGPTGRPGQTKPKTSATPAKKPVAAKPKVQPTPKPDPAAEKAQFEAAIADADASIKAELLVKFVADHPKSEFKTRAEESLAGARAAIADERLTAGDSEGAVRLFKLAVENAPKPYSDRLFTGVISTIPANLYWRGYKTEGIDLAKLIETHIASDLNKLLLLSTFYLGSENGDEAKRIAEAAVKLDEKNSAAHQTLATAHRLNFDLESAAASFAKAVELDPESTISKRSLGDMKRALGKADEAEKIYREILAVNEREVQARTGLVMSLFELGKRSEAEAEMTKALEEVPGNVVLLGSAAYWYAANKEADKAVEYARRAVEKDPRYVWSHIALGRGLMLQGKPVEAEQVLVAARKYGNFPTLQYEIASARLTAGFFREAAEELKKSFRVEDGSVATLLGGRIERKADSFTEAVAMERRASVLVASTADVAEDAARLKALVELTDKVAAESKDVPSIITAAEGFANGSDNMSVHRKLFAANLLLQNNVATDEAATLASSAVPGIDRSLEVADPGAAVMAGELYEARNASFSRDDFLLVPDVPKQTLTALMRGRVEETTGLALLRQGKAEEATVRFRRALTVLPKNSAWWRSATWNLGTSLAAEGKDKEALDAMIVSYAIDKPNVTRYILIEQLWVKTNGSRDGLEQKIGPNPMPSFVAAKPVPTPNASPAPAETTAPTDAVIKAETTPNPQPEVVTVAATRTPESSPTPEVPTLTPTPEPSPSDTNVKATSTPEATPTPEPSPVEKTPTESPLPELSPTPSPSPAEIAVRVTPTPGTSPSPEPMATPTTDPSASEPAKISNETVAKAETKKSLFDPIVITIPWPAVERKPAVTSDPSPAEKQTSEPPVNAESTVSEEPSRPRVVVGKEIVGELLPCEIGVSQESVSLINSGGSISMLVSIEAGEDVSLVNAVSNSPADIEVKLQADTPSVAGRSMFVVKSISEKTGLFQVSFKAPCGKKDVIVRVR